MARSIANLLALLGVCAAAHAAGPQLDENQPIELDARSSDFDYKSNSLLFRAVHIAQGRLWIEADEATANGLNFEASVWRFTGHVRVGMVDGTLESDQALITFANNQVSVAEITGAPASFEQKRPNGVSRGHAARIEYRPMVGTVVANPDDQGDQRVRLTIQPKKSEKVSPSTEMKPKP